MRARILFLAFLFLTIFKIPLFAQSTPTANVGFSKPTIGATANWGALTNADWDQLDKLLGGTQTLALNSTTPSVAAYKNWIASNSSNTAISNFTGGYPGQQLNVVCNDSHTTIASGANITVTSSFACSSASGISFVLNGTMWIEIGRGGGGSGGGTSITVNGGSAVGSPANFQSTSGSAGSITVSQSGSNINFNVANIQGTDTKLLSVGTITGTTGLLCVDSNSGATNVGCPSSSITLETNGTNNAVQNILNALTTTANIVGLTVTPTYVAGGGMKYEISGANYSGTAALATSPAGTPTVCGAGLSASGVTTAFAAAGCTTNTLGMFNIKNYGATGDNGAETALGTISSGSPTLAISSSTGTWQKGMGISIYGAGASGDTLVAVINNVVGSTLTLDRNASTTVTNANTMDDDTIAIQNAMAAFCAAPNSGGGSIFFPPGAYIFSQPQSTNANGVPFNVACPGMHFLGGNAKYQGSAFVQAPETTLTARCGPSMNAKAAFVSDYPNGGTSFENLIINACNQAVEVQANVVHFTDTTLQVGATGLTDNTPLHIWDTFWVWYKGGAIITSSTTTIPAVLMTGDTCSGCYAGVGNIYFQDVLLAGGPISYIQRGAPVGAVPGHLVVRNVTQESGNGDLIKISSTGGNFNSFGPITLDDVQQSDNLAAQAALINFNMTGKVLQGLFINNSAPTGNVAVIMTAGTLQHAFLTGCTASSNCANEVQNSSGVPVGGAIMENTFGFDILEDGTTANGSQFITAPMGIYNISGMGPSIRLIQSGFNFSNVMLSAQVGLSFGSQNQAGINAQVYQSTAPNVDIAFAANFPPTNVAATPSNSGGSLTAGTYYIYGVSTLTNSCASASSFSAPSNIAGPYTITGSSGSLAVTWTAAAAGATPISGYCILAFPLKQYSSSATSSPYISGAGTTSATVTSVVISSAALPISYTMVPLDHFTLNSAIFNNVSTPSISGSAPYTPSCVASITCGAMMSLNPFIADSFTRANASTLGANWSTSAGSGNLTISSNTVTIAGTNYGIESWVPQTFLADQFSRATVNALTNGASDGVAVVVRNTGTATRTNYELICTNGTLLIRKQVAGVQTTLSTGSACANGNTIELDAVGGSTSYLSAFVNGGLTLTATDSSSAITSGQPGIEVWNSSDSLTNWIGGSLAQGRGAQALVDQYNVWPGEQNFQGGSNASQFVGTGSTPVSLAPENNDTSTGTTVKLLATINSSGNFIKATTGNTAVPTYITAASVTANGQSICAPGTSAKGCFVIYGNGTCTFDAAGGTAGHFVVTSTATAGRCEDGGATVPSGVWTVGQLLTSPAANADGIVFVSGGFVANTGGSTPTAATPTFSPNGGSQTYPVTVTLNDSTSGAIVHYTTDGSSPTDLSAGVAAGGTFSLASAATVKALAVSSGYNNSSIASAVFTSSSVTAACDPTTDSGGCTILASIPINSVLWVGVFGEYSSNPTLVFTDTCGDTFSNALVASDAGASAGMVSAMTKTTCGMTGGSGTISVSGGGINGMFAYFAATSAGSINDAATAADISGSLSSWSVGPTSAISGTNDICFAMGGQTTSFSGGPYNFTPGAGWTLGPGNNNVYSDARMGFAEYKTFASGTVTATATGAWAGGGGFGVSCAKLQ